MLRELIVGGTVLGLSACAVAPSLSTNGAALPIGDVSTQAPDGIAVYGTTYFAD